jgi:hypothetical protein
MKENLKLSSILSSIMIMMIILNGCSKSEKVTPPAQQPAPNLTADGKHAYGLNTMTPDMYASIPVYSAEAFHAQFNDLTVTPAPPVLTLATPAIRDQGTLGSCTSFCGAEAYEIMYRYKNGAFPAVLSPAFLYYEERVNILHEKITADDGAYMVDIDLALQKYGICTEALYVYPSSDVSTAYKTPPTSAAISNALNYKISAYTLINTGDTAAVKNCLRHNIPVMMGLNVYDNKRTYQYFEGLNTTSYTYNPLTSTGAIISGLTLLGGHATPIIGYDDTKKAFKVQNSWGTSWGLSGFYYMPYSVFSSTKIVPQGGVYYAAI